jgi:hypothetical protein
MKIASVLLVCNAKEWRVKKALKSRQEQIRKPDEIQIIRQKEGEINFARMCNIAIKKTKCDYICFSGVDEIVSPNAFQVVEHYFNKNPNSLLMCARIDLPEESNHHRIDFVKNFNKWAKGKPNHAAPGSFQCLPVKWLKKVRGFDERYRGWGYYDCEIVKRAEMDKIEAVWLHDSNPSMILLHIWHPERKGKVSELIDRNRKLYEQKQELVANKGKRWGEEWGK